MISFKLAGPLLSLWISPRSNYAKKVDLPAPSPTQRIISLASKKFNALKVRDKIMTQWNSKLKCLQTLTGNINVRLRSGLPPNSPLAANSIFKNTFLAQPTNQPRNKHLWAITCGPGGYGPAGLWVYGPMWRHPTQVLASAVSQPRACCLKKSEPFVKPSWDVLPW